MSSDQYPQFETGTPAAQYQQIINYSINYLEGLLVDLAHMDLPPEFESNLRQYAELQQKLISRERTVRHGFQYQIEKLFTEFRTFRRARLNANRSSDWFSLGLAGHNSSRVLSSIESISAQLMQRFDRKVFNLNRRLKSLVHRTDDAQNDNPLSPENLCHAFLSSVDALNLTSLQTCRMFDLFGYVLQQQLDTFYKQLDLGLYHLDVLPELTDSSLFLLPEESPAQQVAPSSENLTGEPSAKEVENEVTAFDSTIVADVNSLSSEQDASSIADASEDIVETPESELEIDEAAAEVLQFVPIASEPEVAERKPSTDELPAQFDAEEHAAPSIEQAEEFERPSFDKTVPDMQAYVEQTGANISSPHSALADLLRRLREQSKDGFDNHAEQFLDWHRQVNPLLTTEQVTDARKFTHYYANLLSSPMLSEALSHQMSRLSASLFDLVLHDPGFFTDESHTVQNFINSVVDFEIRCKHDAEPMEKLVNIIDQLVEIDTPEALAFEPLTRDYESMKKSEIQFIVQQQKDKKKLENQLKDEVLGLIKSVTSRLSLEPETHAFFYDDWQLLLLQLGKKIGRHSNAFEQAADITRMLGVALNESADESLAENYGGVAFPSLLKAVDKGLESLGYGSEHRTRVRKQLISEFRKRNIRNVHDADVAAAPAVQPATNTVELFSSTIRSHSSKLSDIHTPVPVSKQPDTSTLLACQLDIGTWVELSLGSGGKTFKRAKLKWKSKSRDEFVFVDQRGHKIRQLSEDELDKELADGTIKPLKLGNSPERKKKPTARLGSGFHF